MILFFSDAHIHTHRIGATVVDSTNSRLESGLSALQVVVDRATKNDIEAVIFAGDMFHIAPTPYEVYNRVVETMKPILSKTYMICGNHDLQGLGFSGEYSTPFKVMTDMGARSLHNTKYDLSFATISGQHYNRKGVDVISIPVADIVVLHSFIQGAEVKDNLVLSGKGHEFFVPDEVKLVVAGDIHKHQIMQDGKLLIPGAINPVNSDDTGEYGYWLLDKTFELSFTAIPYVPIEVAEKEKIVVIDKLSSDVSLDIEQSLLDYLKDLRSDNDISVGLDYVTRAKANIDEKPVSDYFISKVSGLGFGSFNEFSYEVNKGVTLVSGIVDENADKSNGSGKSTLFEAIAWGLWGKTSKKVPASDVINKDVSNCEVCIILDSPTKPTLEVTRKRSKSSQVLEFSSNNEIVSGKVDDVQKELDSIINVSFDTFQECSYLSQEQVILFSRMSNSDRKGLLSKVLGLSVYDGALDLIKSDLSKNIKEYEEIKLKNTILQTKLDSSKALVLKLQDELVGKKEKLNNHKAISINSTLPDNVVSELISARNSIISTVVKLKEKIEALLEATRGYTSELGTINSTIAEIDNKVYKEKADFKRINSKIEEVTVMKVGNTCDYCGSVITEEHKNMYKNILQDELALIQKNLLKLNTTLEEHKKNRISVSSSIDSLNDAISIIKKDILEKEQSVGDINKRLDKDSYERKEFSNLSKVLTENVEDLKKKITVEEATNNKYCSDIMVLKDMEAKLLEANEGLTFWSQVFGPNGFSTYLLKAASVIICDYVNNVLVKSEAGFTSSIDVIKKNIVAELSLSIHKNGDTIDYKSLSGGEKQKIDVALLLAILRLFETKWGFNSGVLGILVLDEVISYLDQHNMEVIVDEIKQATARAIFVITHITELKSLFDSNIVVHKKDGISFLED